MSAWEAAMRVRLRTSRATGPALEAWARRGGDGVPATPVTRYARSGSGESVAYQIVGDGPLDLVFVPGFVSNVEVFWSEPAIAAFYERLASFSRLILFDKRGTGLSDPLQGPQTLEERIEDVRAVMDAAGSERAAILGLSEGSAMAIVFAASDPGRVSHLVLCGAIIGGDAGDHPAGARWGEVARGQAAQALTHWGDGSTIRLMAPTAGVTDRQLGTLERAGASPRMAQALLDMWLRIDIRDVLPAISVPTLVLHRTEELFPIEAARDIAARIPGARLVELPGRDHSPWFGDADAYLGEIEEFLTGTREGGGGERVLATVLVTDIVASTERAATLGDAAWRALVTRHDELVRSALRRFHGREVKHTGDGFLATFDGPARAIRCAGAILERTAEELELGVRAGIHTGEIDLVGDDVRGIAVHIATRVASHAGAGELLVSGTVRELVIGSGILLEDTGRHDLKGVPGEWALFRLGSGEGSRVAAS